MAAETTDVVTFGTDPYQVATYVEAIKQKHIDIPTDTLYVGVFGYLSSLFSNLIQNTAHVASEYSNEAIPTKAKFERNVISHALSLGINRIFATPAEIDVLIGLPETALLENMRNNKFILDKEFSFIIGEDQQYPYHLDYDIIIRRDKLPNGRYVYNAKYDIEDNYNELANLTNPYLPALGEFSLEGDSMVALQVTLRQITHTEIHKKIVTTNPLESKVFSFEFQDQLAYFYVDVVEDGKTYHLKPIYDGLYDYSPDTKYINYMFLDDKNIRLMFNRESYQPRQNAEVTIHVFTTLGSKCNFHLQDYSVVRPLTSDRYTYSSMFIYLQNYTDSQFGVDKLDIDTLKQAIPREMLARGSITTYTDLNNVFNAMQTEDVKLYFLEKVHNQEERLYYSYLMLKEGMNIVPTNTINALVSRGMFDINGVNSFIIKPGAAYYIDPTTKEIEGIINPSESQVEDMDANSFLYMNPFLTVINKSPFYVSYYMTLINYSRTLYFEYINEDSILQFIVLGFRAKREYYTDPDTFKIEITANQNINTDFQLINYGSGGGISNSKIKAFAVLYSKDLSGEEIPVRYMEAELMDFNESNYAFNFQFSFKTNDLISAKGTYIHSTSGLKTIQTGLDSEYDLPTSLKMKMFFLVEFDTVPANGRRYMRYDKSEFENLDDLIPGLDRYTLTNVYDAGEEGLDIFYDYTDLMNSFINIESSSGGNYNYRIYKMPVFKYTWMDSEERFRYVLDIIDKRRRYMQAILLLLEDSFGIDYKLFNTYGPSLMYNIEEEENIDRINLSLTFEVKFQLASEKTFLPSITNSIKEYIENMNYISDLHIPNLITFITNTYRDQLVYIKLIKINNYDSLQQSIYKNPEFDKNYFVETQTVPEFININTLRNGNADINYIIKE